MRKSVKKFGNVSIILTQDDAVGQYGVMVQHKGEEIDGFTSSGEGGKEGVLEEFAFLCRIFESITLRSHTPIENKLNVIPFNKNMN